MFPTFCHVCIAGGYDLPPVGTGSIEDWDAHDWRSKVAVTVSAKGAFCARHWNERVGAARRGTYEQVKAEHGDRTEAAARIANRR